MLELASMTSRTSSTRGLVRRKIASVFESERMGARLFHSSDDIDEPIEELSLVALSRAFAVPDDGRTLPEGAIGTVVGVLERGGAFVVEFAEPFAALVDLAPDHLVAVPGESRADLAARHLARRAS